MKVIVIKAAAVFLAEDVKQDDRWKIEQGHRRIGSAMGESKCPRSHKPMPHIWVLATMASDGLLQS